MAHSAVRHVWFHFGSALLAVLLLCAVPAACARSIGALAGIALALPIGAALVFVLGFSWKIARWMRAPIPFRITLTTGQQRGAGPEFQERFASPHSLGQ